MIKCLFFCYVFMNLLGLWSVLSCPFVMVYATKLLKVLWIVTFSINYHFRIFQWVIEPINQVYKILKNKYQLLTSWDFLLIFVGQHAVDIVIIIANY